MINFIRSSLLGAMPFAVVAVFLVKLFRSGFGVVIDRNGNVAICTPANNFYALMRLPLFEYEERMNVMVETLDEVVDEHVWEGMDLDELLEMEEE